MAGGMDWFRWHHGSTTDHKFRLVAKRAGARVAEVLAVWACLLEAASAAEDRGNAGAPDFESLDLALDMDDGTACRIYERMCERALIDSTTGRILAWEKRQPKREREDDGAAERKRRQREREAAGVTAAVTPSHASNVTVTTGHAGTDQVTPRGEEKREEQKEINTQRPARKRAAAAQLVGVENLVAAGVVEQHARDWLLVRSKRKLPLTLTAWEEVITEAKKAGIAVGAAVHKSAKEGWGGFKAKWLTDPQRGHAAAPADDAAVDAEAQRLLGFSPPKNARLLESLERV